MVVSSDFHFLAFVRQGCLGLLILSRGGLIVDEVANASCSGGMKMGFKRWIFRYRHLGAEKQMAGG